MVRTLSYFLFFFTIIAYSQEYKPLLKDGNKWYEKNVDYRFDSPSPLTETVFFLNGSEVQNGKSYKKLFKKAYCYTYDMYLPCQQQTNPEVFVKLLREDINERKVYYYDETSSSDVLLYDFSLKVSDIHPSNFPYFYKNSEGGELKIAKDNLKGKVFNREVRALHFGDPDSQYFTTKNTYEGIGSNIGLMAKPGTGMFEGGNWLICFEDIENGKSCESDFIALGTKESFKMKSFSLIYDKMKNTFKVVGNSSENLNIEFYDSSARRIGTKMVKANENFVLENIVQSKVLFYKITSLTKFETGKVMID